MTREGDSAFWLRRLDTLTRRFELGGAESAEPLCFLLGTEAARSSGIPETERVAQALVDMQRGDVPNLEAAFNGSYRIGESQRARYIDGLFADTSPYIGMRCLAQLAVKRPVIVVSTSWDVALEKASERVPEIECSSVSIADPAEVEAEVERLTERGWGLVLIHLTGRVQQGEVFFVQRQPLPLDAAQLDVLRRCCFVHETVVIGTALTRPERIPLIDALRPAPGSATPRPLWVVERRQGPKFTPGIGKPARKRLTEVLHARKSPEGYVGAPDVDFDALLVAMRAAERELRWPDVVAMGAAQDIELPSEEELVRPAPDVLRPYLDVNGALLLGRSRLGTTAIAVQLAYWRALLDESAMPQIYQGAEAAAAAAPEVLKPGSTTIAVFNNALGRPEYVRKPKLLEAFADAIPDDTTLLVTTWPELLAEAGDDSRRLEERLERVELRAETIWPGEVLDAYARRIAPTRADELCHRIASDELRTPADVHDQLQRRVAAWEDQRDEHTYAHLGTLHRRAPAQARLIALARLQDFSMAQRAEVLERLAGASVDEALADPSELVVAARDDRRVVKLAGIRVRHAVDRWLREHEEWFEGFVNALGESGRWARTALGAWRTFVRLDYSGHAIRGLPSTLRDLYTLELIERAARRSSAEAVEVIDALVDAAETTWQLKDVALALTLSWDRVDQDDRMLGEQAGARAAVVKLARRHELRGGYALLEAVLRLRGSAPPELQQLAIGELVEGVFGDPERRREAALGFDALLWAPPQQLASKDYVALMRALVVAAEGDDLLQAAYAFSAAYHFGESSRLAGQIEWDRFGVLSRLDEAGAREMAWMMEWHLLEQSRHRAAVSRLPFRSSSGTEGEEFLRTELTDRELDPRWADAIVAVFKRMAGYEVSAGWAIHLLMNVRTTIGKFALPDLSMALANAAPSDPGLISAAITYVPASDIQARLLSRFEEERGRTALLRALSGRIEFHLEGDTSANPPNFMLTTDPWRVRNCWRVSNLVLDLLGVPYTSPEKRAESFTEAARKLIEQGRDPELVDLAVGRLGAGDTTDVELVMAREIENSSRLPEQVDLAEALSLVVDRLEPEQMDLMP